MTNNGKYCVSFHALKPTLRKASLISGSNLFFKNVDKEDASFILSLRTDNSKNKYLSKTANDIDKQLEYIDNYQQDNNQAYFIIQDKNNNKIGTVRLYSPIENLFCWGSWILVDGCNYYYSIESALMVYSYGLFLGFNGAYFDVRNHNLSVKKFHERFGAKIVRQDDVDTFYKIGYEDIMTSLVKYQKYLPNGIIVNV